MPIVTQKPLTLSLFVQDIATALLTFNRMRVFRSRTGSNGLYGVATQEVASPAVLYGANPEPHQLNGKTLKFRVNGAVNVNVPFLGADPYTTAAVIADIILATALVVPTADPDGRLILATVTTGSASSIEILESDGAAFLGFNTGAASVGLDADLILVPGTHEYFYTDQNSDRSFFYRYQLLHSVTLQVSDLSVPIPASQVQNLDYTKSITCYVKLVDLQGHPIEGRRVTFANPFMPNTIIQSGTRYGIFRHYATMITDRDGYAEIRILRGMQVDLSVDGSGFVRRILIPTVGDSVDLLDPVLVVKDEFGIQEPQIDFAIRTT